MSKAKIRARIRAEKMICGGCLLLILIRLAASYFASERLWGVNLLHYLPPAWRWILACCAILILIPSISKACGSLFTALSRTIPSGFRGANKYHRYAFLSLAGGALFWALRVKTYLLGDSYMRAREINVGHKLSFNAPLDSLLHAKVAGLFGWDGFQAYAVFSVLAGMVFLFLVLLLGDLMAKNHEERLLIFCVIVSMGANQLFFGYVESYTLMYVAMIAYLLFSLSYLRNKNGLALPVVAFLLSVTLHLSAVILLPSLIYLALSKRPRKTGSEKTGGKFFRIVLTTGIGLMAVVGLLPLQDYSLQDEGLGYYLIFPVGTGESSYSLLSFPHLLDLINHQLLVSPVGILIFLASVLVFSREINFKEHVIGFLLILSMCSLAYSFFMDPKLGYPRDWDLFAFTALGYTLLWLHVFLRYWRAAERGHLRYITLSLLFASLISTVPWVSVNAKEEKAVTRFEHLLALDRERSAHGHEALALYYDMRGELQKEIEQWKKAIALEGNVRHINNLATAYYKQRRYDLALKELERSLEVDSTFHYTHFSLGEVLGKMGRHEEARAELREAIRLKPDAVQYYSYLGVCLASLGRHREAADVVEQALKVSPEHALLYRDLGYTYFSLENPILAEKYLRLYLERSPQAEDRADVQRSLKDLPQERPGELRP